MSTEPQVNELHVDARLAVDFMRQCVNNQNCTITERLIASQGLILYERLDRVARRLHLVVELLEKIHDNQHG